MCSTSIHQPNNAKIWSIFRGFQTSSPDCLLRSIVGPTNNLLPTQGEFTTVQSTFPFTGCPVIVANTCSAALSAYNSVGCADVPMSRRERKLCTFLGKLTPARRNSVALTSQRDWPFGELELNISCGQSEKPKTEGGTDTNHSAVSQLLLLGKHAQI